MPFIFNTHTVVYVVIVNEQFCFYCQSFRLTSEAFCNLFLKCLYSRLLSIVAPEKAKIYSNKSGKAIKRGEQVTVECTASSNPAPTFTIDRNKHIVVNMLRTGKYVISSFSSGDAGEYSCEVHNEVGSVIVSGVSLTTACKNMINTFLCVFN